MNRTVTILVLLLPVAGFLIARQNTATINNPMKPAKVPKISTDNEPRATGIGGIFFFSENPAETKKWYASNLGLCNKF